VLASSAIRLLPDFVVSEIRESGRFSAGVLEIVQGWSRDIGPCGSPQSHWTSFKLRRLAFLSPAGFLPSSPSPSRCTNLRPLPKGDTASLSGRKLEAARFRKKPGCLPSSEQQITEALSGLMIAFDTDNSGMNRSRRRLAFKSSSHRRRHPPRALVRHFAPMSAERLAMTRPPLPPYTEQTAVEKVRLGEDAWNTWDATKVSLAYSENSQWRNRIEFLTGREAICSFLTCKWRREINYR